MMMKMGSSTHSRCEKVHKQKVQQHFSEKNDSWTFLRLTPHSATQFFVVFYFCALWTFFFCNEIKAQPHLYNGLQQAYNSSMEEHFNTLGKHSSMWKVWQIFSAWFSSSHFVCSRKRSFILSSKSVQNFLHFKNALVDLLKLILPEMVGQLLPVCHKVTAGGQWNSSRKLIKLSVRGEPTMRRCRPESRISKPNVIGS